MGNGNYPLYEDDNYLHKELHCVLFCPTFFFSFCCTSYFDGKWLIVEVVVTGWYSSDFGTLVHCIDSLLSNT